MALEEDCKRERAFQFDSRKCGSGDCFIALKGEKTDGHLYLEEVAKRGAVSAIVSKDYTGETFGLTLIRVQDPLAEVQRLAKEAILKKKPTIVAITGSVGKTTTKEFIFAILKEHYKVTKTPGSYNSQISLPTFILNTKDEDVFVLEMGASMPGNLDSLLQIAPPDFAVITHISHSHVEFFKDVEGVAKEKGKILKSQHLKAAVVNVQAMPFLEGAKVNTYGEGGDFSLERSGDALQIRAFDTLSPVFELPFTAPHLQEDFLGAAAICFQMGLSLFDIVKAAKSVAPFTHRFERVEKEGIVFIDDSYNASVSSFLAAFKALPKTDNGKRVLVMGEMREMGDYAKLAHDTVGEKAIELFDEAFCIGDACASIVDLFDKAKKKATLFDSKDKLRDALFEGTKKGDVVLIKGANSFKLWELIDYAAASH